MTPNRPPALSKLNLLAISLLLAAGVVSAAGPTTKAWEETITLPTYKVAPADPNPRFYAGRTYQGAKATFYPYPVSDQMTEVKADQRYRAVYLENEYVQFSVLPELGGRIFTAVDKGNRYDFFYRQRVIKPALIGMLGAWISGGVEWNVPHHHRASSFMPVDYTIERCADGSRTVWVGEIELRHRMKWMVGMTLRPDRSYIEMTVKLFNRTPEAQSFLFWINPAVHANADYQVIFPPSTEWAVQHAKPEFAAWPIARQFYGGNDYTRGVDISWWKNHPSPVSFFAWDCQEDFFGGYDHGKRAGVAQISDHHVSPGKKFFEWGNGSEGQMWSEILSDNDGHYLELMAGSYSDNQPDYSWIEPGEVKVFKHFWYPIRELGGIKNANTDAAVNLELTNGTAQLAFNTTKAFKGARVQLTKDGQVLLARQITISPTLPFTASVSLPTHVPPESLRASLSFEGRELIAHTPIKPPGSSKPKPVERPRPPKEISSAEELYLTGLRIEQLYSPAYEPAPYYLEALKRDPKHYRAGTALGAMYCRQGRLAEAEEVLQQAVQTITANYIRPKDCEAVYYLAVALRGLGREQEAWNAFYKAIWDKAWQCAAYHALAEIACSRTHYQQALEFVQRSLENGALNTKALELKAGLLRKLGRFSEASACSDEILNIDPLNGRALCEKLLLAKVQHKNSRNQKNDFAKALRGETSSYLELAADYLGCGLHSDGATVLQSFIEQCPERSSINPLVYYYLGYLQHLTGDDKTSLESLKIAAGLSPEFCFPFQHEAESILNYALAKNPADARAALYLGNLYFDHQPTKAIAVWERSIQAEPGLAMAQRNLGLAKGRTQKDLVTAVLHLEKAVTLKPDDPRYYYELDSIYEAAGSPLQKRLDSLSRNLSATTKRDDATTRWISLLIAAGRPEEAVQVLRSRHFHNWEGSSSLHDVWVDACIQNGLKQLKQGDAGSALKSFEAAREYPRNQEVGKARRDSRMAQIQFCRGLAAEKLGQKVEAQRAFQAATEGRPDSSSPAGFFKALALRKLGREDDARKIFSELERKGLAETERNSEEVDYFAKFGEKRSERVKLAEAHYTAALGSLGLGKQEEAERHLRQTLEEHPAHLGALSDPAQFF